MCFLIMSCVPHFAFQHRIIDIGIILEFVSERIQSIKMDIFECVLHKEFLNALVPSNPFYVQKTEVVP